MESGPSSPDLQPIDACLRPVLARPTTRQRPPETCHRHIVAMRARTRSVVAQSRTRRRLLRTCRRLNCDPFFNLRTSCCASYLLSYLSSPGYYSSSAEFTRRRELRTRHCLPSPVVARYLTRPHNPSRTRPVPVHAIPISTRTHAHFSALRQSILACTYLGNCLWDSPQGAKHFSSHVIDDYYGRIYSITFSSTYCTCNFKLF